MSAHRFLAATAMAGTTLLLTLGNATAQETTPPAADGAATNGEAIVVTGSRIARPNLESTIPITSVSGDEFFQTGNVAIGDVLNELPSLRSTYSQANSTRFLGTSGLNLLDLRGLGTQRTLVLVNGRRHVGSDILNNAVSPDTNTFPADLIERVEVVTGGSSAVYGSDAVAGVVNFILKRDFEGVQLRGQSGVSTYGDAGAYFGSVLAGTNFADGRGNIAINAEYARQNQYFASGRPFERQDAFVVVDTDPAGSPNGADNTPDRQFFQDVRSATLNNTGLVRFGGSSALNCGIAGNGSRFNCPYAFQPDGTLVPVTGTRIGIGPNGNFVGGNGENFRTGDQFQLTPALERYNFNLLAHFTVSDAFEPFIEAKYSRTDSSGTGNSGPAFITGTTLGDPQILVDGAGVPILDPDGFEIGDSREQPKLSNPFLSAQARALITSQLTLANGAAPGPDDRFSLRENMTGLGSRIERARRETYRIVAGVRGKFNDDWSYEIAANYGDFKEKTRVLGNLNVQRFLLGIDAVVDPGSGQIVCNSKINPFARTPYVPGAAQLAADIAACVPINLFGGQFSQAQRNYLLSDTTSVGKITQFDATASVSGDLSQLFELPGGPVGFSIGGEYRRETNSFRADPLVEQGYTFYNALPTFTPPRFEVYEAFGEVRVPILKDQLIHELTFSGAGRVSHYKGTAGTVYAYNGGVDLSPFDGLRFRANYSRSVRAPNLVELYSAAGQNFATVVDPCSARNIGTGSATRAANCAAAGIPAAYDFVYSGSLEIVSGGNPNLQAEKSDSFTVGGVLTPAQVPGLSLSVDYYNIRVKNTISSVDAQTILDQCYDQTSLNNSFCGLFKRAGAGGGPNGEIPFQVLEGSLLQSSLNFALLKSRGIDAELAYRHQIGSIGLLNTRLTYTHTFERSDFLDPTDPTRADRILSELGDPKDEFTWNVDLKTGPFTAGYRMRYVGKQVLNAAEDIFSVQGRDPENADYGPITYYPSTFYHSVRGAVEVNKRFSFYGGVDNVLNTLPPFGLSGIGGGSGIYDARGRFFYAGIEAKF
jgi:outer membrane receptor protein involved in Fe transport